MFGCDECVKAGGRIWVRRDALDEVRYKGIGKLFVTADDVVEDFLQPGISRIHESDGERRE